MNQRQAETWTQTRRLGRLRYVLVFGICGPGVLFATFGLVSRYYSILHDGWSGFPWELYEFLYDAVFFGTMFSLWQWHSNEKKFQTFSTEQECQHASPKTDASNGSKAICRAIDASRSPSPHPRRSPN
jgi:hypothetical protein